MLRTVVLTSASTVTPGRKGAHGQPHRPMTTYATVTTDDSLIDLKQKCKKFAIYKLLEAILGPLCMCAFLLAFNVKNEKEQRFFMVCLLSYSILCLMSGLTCLKGLAKETENNIFLRLCLYIDVLIILLPIILFIAAIFFGGPVFIVFLPIVSILYFPYNIYSTYTIKYYLDRLKSESTQSTTTETTTVGSLQDFPNGIV